MSNISIRLEGQSAIVTGAGAGIGRAIALALADAGAAVAINDLNPDRSDDLADEINNSGGRAIAFQGDVSNRFQAAALIETAREAFGRIHILINAAGLYKSQPVLTIDEWDWRRQLEVITTGTFFCSQLLGRVMADEGGGCIVNIASTAGYTHNLPQGAGYVTAKAGVVALTSQLARELAPQNIRVNAVCPNFITEPDMPTYDNPANAMQRTATPEKVAQVALFLCSDGASFITGQALVVDGGGY
ncbi:MAG: SDR family NAD(P)-dependent oxidoreductase [Aggregatilineales bacterium]